MASPIAAELKRHLIKMILLVAALDVVAIGAYYGLHVGSTSSRGQAIFAGTWTVLTLAIVLVGLGRIRASRQRARRQRG
jgi:heme/copper-type cytochrome/quinol oxidase subunit 4